MLKQRVRTYLEIIGDGTSTSFAFELRDLYGLNISNYTDGSGPFPFCITNPDAIPDDVEIGPNVFGTSPSGYSISGKTITLTWATAPSSGSDNKFQLYVYFNG